MRLTLASRKSDLAKIQALTVAEALRRTSPDLEIHHHYRESLGDINLTEALWKMPERGVFTEDFVRGLIEGDYDAVIHSWKDLPTEPRAETEIIATLPREDVRDCLLLRADAKTGVPWRILSSSPRRAENLQYFFDEFLPLQPSGVEFIPVRGNIQRRIEKLIEGEGEALIVAKAALDRLLGDQLLAKDDPSATLRQLQLREYVQKLWVIVLPLELNPPAAAQGALAIEIKKDRPDLKELFAKINCVETFQNVMQERTKLREFGGGCHLKIGVVRVPLTSDRVWAHVEVEKGMTPEGLRFERKNLTPVTARAALQLEGATPVLAAFRSAEFFSSKPYSVDEITAQPVATTPPTTVTQAHWHIAHSKAATPALFSLRGLQTPQTPWTWCSGLESWKKLVRMGYWIRGSDENLGTDAGLSHSLGTLSDLQVGKASAWIKISHRDSFETARPVTATYQNFSLAKEQISNETLKQLNQSNVFYWHSVQLFEEALKLAPAILNHDHSCGPGQTRMRLESILGRSLTDRVFMSEQEWRDWCG